MSVCVCVKERDISHIWGHVSWLCGCNHSLCACPAPLTAAAVIESGQVVSVSPYRWDAAEAVHQQQRAWLYLPPLYVVILYFSFSFSLFTLRSQKTSVCIFPVICLKACDGAASLCHGLWFCYVLFFFVLVSAFHALVLLSNSFFVVHCVEFMPSFVFRQGFGLLITTPVLHLVLDSVNTHTLIKVCSISCRIWDLLTKYIYVLLNKGHEHPFI